MNNILTELEQRVSDFLLELDNSFFIVQLDIIESSRKINLILDGDQGIQIQFCHKTAKFIRRLLEEEELDFEIQVSSPGLDNKFVLWRQFKKNLNRKMKLKLKDKDGQLKVRLIDIIEETKTLVFSEKIKKETIQHTFDFEQIEHAKIIIEF